VLLFSFESTVDYIAIEVFLVKDLKGYEWNRISHSSRLLLGTLFLNHVNKSDGGIMPIEKNHIWAAKI